MENNNIIVKVYSNNSKKSRLKRKKNKFYRVWDPESQTYVKRRRPSAIVKTQTKRKEETTVTDAQINAIKRRQKSEKPKKRVEPARVKPVVHAKALGWQTPKKEVEEVVIPLRPVSRITMYGQNFVWDSETLRYKVAAL